MNPQNKTITGRILYCDTCRAYARHNRGGCVVCQAREAVRTHEVPEAKPLTTTQQQWEAEAEARAPDPATIAERARKIREKKGEIA